MASKITVAIDGYSSTGKSTMAKWLAAEVGIEQSRYMPCEIG